MQSRGAGQPEYTRVDTFPSNIPGRPQMICARWARTFGENPDFKDKTFICLPEAVDPRGPAKKRR
jgi:hypothetical protein